MVAQARSRLAGQTPDGATRLASPGARLIREERIDKPVEFGYKAQVIDNYDGIILDYGAKVGNPDALQLAPTIGRIARSASRTPVRLPSTAGMASVLPSGTCRPSGSRRRWLTARLRSVAITRDALWF